MENPGKASETGSKFGGAAVCRNLSPDSATRPDLIDFFHTGQKIFVNFEWKVSSCIWLPQS